MARKSKSEHEHSVPGVRSSWSGMLRFGLVSFPVQAFNAHLRSDSGVSFHQLHAECHRRIRYDKQCPVHGHVDKDEIVSGFEYAKGKYVEIEPAELSELRTEKERALTIDHFVSPEEVDPVYFDGRMYYLAPAGSEALEPYAVFLQALEHDNRYGVGQVVFSGKEQIALIRPYSGALHMALLNYADEIRRPDEVVGALPTVRANDRKVRLAEQLIESWSEDKFDLAEYHDRYVQRAKKLIEAKIEGREVVVPPEEEEPEVINLMDALQQSVKSARRTVRKPKAAAARRKRKPKSRARRAS